MDCTRGTYVSLPYEASIKRVELAKDPAFFLRLSTTRSTPLPVMCGALELSCTRYGVWDANRLRIIAISRLDPLHDIQDNAMNIILL